MGEGGGARPYTMGHPPAVTTTEFDLFHPVRKGFMLYKLLSLVKVTIGVVFLSIHLRKLTFAPDRRREGNISVHFTRGYFSERD